MENAEHFTPKHPKCSVLAHWIGRFVLFITRWKAVGPVPAATKAIFIGAPHTSWLDAVYMLAVAWSLRLKLSWIVKSDYFGGLYGRFLKSVGAVPILRDANVDQVQQLATIIRESDGMYLAVAPAGTRKHSDHWKSGFYYIAREADVPILCTYIDYGRRQGGIGVTIHPSGNVKEDMDSIRNFYKGIVARHPEQTSVIRLRNE